MEFVIIGTGRSGTGFMSKLLNSNGIPCGHESVYGVPVKYSRYQTIAEQGRYKGDSSWLAVPYISEIRKDYPNVKFIHITRNPIDVVKSFLELDLFNQKNIYTSEYVKLIGNHVDLTNKSQIERAISYYIDWFNLIDSFKIEDKVVINLESIDYDLLSRIFGRDIKPINTIVNQKKDKKKVVVSREDVKNEIYESSRFLELKRIANKYDYEL